MDANELLALDRPLTPAEMAVVEDELLRLALELQKEVESLAAKLDGDDEEAERMRCAAAAAVENIEAAIAVPMVPVATGAPREA